METTANLTTRPVDPRGKTPGNDSTRGWEGFRLGLTIWRRAESLASASNRTPDLLARKPIHYTGYTVQTPEHNGRPWQKFWIKKIYIFWWQIFEYETFRKKSITELLWRNGCKIFDNLQYRRHKLSFFFNLLREILRNAYKFATWTEYKELWPPIALTKSIWVEVFRLVLPSCSFDGSDYIFVVLIQFQSTESFVYCCARPVCAYFGAQ